MNRLKIPPGLQENILLTNHTTFRIGGPAKYFLVAKTQKEILEALRWAKENQLPFFMLGGGSNLLVADEGFEGLVIKMKNEKLKIKNENKKIKIIAEAGVPFGKIILETTQRGFSGVEWGLGIPGTVGGAICGNAGRLGQDISSVVEWAKVLDENLSEKTIEAAQCNFSYRESRFKKNNEIILEAGLTFEKREQSLIEQTLNQAKAVVKKSPPYPSAGCVFKNYILARTAAPNSADHDPLLQKYPELAERVRDGKIGVGFLIDQCGLKEKQIGGAKIWEGHANYIVNVGGAKAKDVLVLMKLCQEAVKEKFDIELEEEIRYVGF